MADRDDGYVRFQCRQCGQRLKVRSDREGGDVLQCPRCGSMVNVPLANIEEIAKGADMEETGQPGRLNVKADLLLERLRMKGPQDGEQRAGGPPSLRETKFGATASFSRLSELDQLAASVSKIDQEMIGQLQRLFRERGLKPEDREVQFEGIAERRKREIEQLLKNRLFGLKQEVRALDAQRERLERRQRQELEAKKMALEALQLCAKYVYDLDL